MDSSATYHTLDESAVVVWKSDNSEYPKTPPFHPRNRYPEIPHAVSGGEPNTVYDGVRQTFRLAGLDTENYGSSRWNPLARVIRKGDTVLLKPNLVKERHPRDPRGWQYVLTHGSIIRAVADYAFKALAGTGRVIVGDAPQTDSSFSQIVKILSLDKLAEYYHSHGLEFYLRDFRREEWVAQDEVIISRKNLPGDPEGNIRFDLADKSEFRGHEGSGKYYGADYDSRVVNDHHDGIKNEYLIAGTAIKCDVFFNLPKLKTHKKAGVTINLKNLVGVNGDKNWLPHHTEGAPENGGDQFPRASISNVSETSLSNVLKRTAVSVPIVGPRILRLARPLGKKLFGDTENTIRSGNWYGNDTVWRMTLDLNKLVLYGNPDGTMREDNLARRKRYLSLVDGIIAGEGSGPMNPDPVNAGILLFGVNPVAVDAVGATIMGFDPDLIPTISWAFAIKHYPLTFTSPDDLTCISNFGPWNDRLASLDPSTLLAFKPHFGWVGYIEPLTEVGV